MSVDIWSWSHRYLIYNWAIRNYAPSLPWLAQPSAGESLIKKSVVTSTSIDFKARKTNRQYLVNTEHVFLPPFRIKLGLWNVMLRLYIKTEVCLLLKNKFPRINKTKVKEGIFMGPLIREVTWGSAFDVTLITEAEGTAWRTCKHMWARIS